MASHEHGDTQQPDPGLIANEPLAPTALPPDLADFLKERAYGCLTHPTDQGTVLVIKAPGREIESVRGRVPIGFRHELYERPTAPVIRMTTTIYDQPDRPLALETFINVGDPEQRSDYEGLASQKQLYMLFYDEGLAHRLTKAVGGLGRDRVADVLSRADALFHAIPEDQFDFDIAKAWVMARTSL